MEADIQLNHTRSRQSSNAGEAAAGGNRTLSQALKLEDYELKDGLRAKNGNKGQRLPNSKFGATTTMAKDFGRDRPSAKSKGQESPLKSPDLLLRQQQDETKEQQKAVNQEIFTSVSQPCSRTSRPSQQLRADEI